MSQEEQEPLESSLESSRECDGQVFTITMSFRMVDQNLFDIAINDLEDAEVWGEDEGPDDNTIEENIDILVGHIDVLSYHREQHNIGWCEMGLERVTL